MVSEWRDRLMPQSALAMAVLILAFSVGAAFSGVVFFSYYQFRKDRTEEKVDALTKNFDTNFNNAIKTIQKSGAEAKDQIQKELEPLQRIRAEGDTLEELVKKVRGSLFFVSSLDEGGAASVGTGFVVASDSNQSLLLTSYSTVRAATHQPGPPITVRQGDQAVKATLWTWQEDKDLALLILQKGNVPRVVVRATHAGGQDRRPCVRVVRTRRVRWRDQPGLRRRRLLGRHPTRRRHRPVVPGRPAGELEGRGPRPSPRASTPATSAS